MARTTAPAFTLQVGPHAATSLVVTRFSGSESLSRLYDFRIEFFEKDGQLLELSELPGTQAQLTIRVGEAPARYVHGLVRQAEALGRIGGRWRYQVQVVPKLERLCQMRKSRIFQEQTVPDIVKAVLGEAGVEHRATLSGSYGAREYCVQYRESDFDFISRLLEAEGIFYFFEHSDGSHTLVLGDGANAHADLLGGGKLPLRSADKRAHDEEFISGMEKIHRLRPGAVMLRDFDFEKPALDISANSTSDDGVAALELYDYPAEYVVPGVGKALSQVRMEEKAQGAQTHTGTSVCPRLAPGYLFEVEDPEAGTFSGQYLAEEVIHSGHQPDTLGPADTLGGLYSNNFQCLTKAVPFRPLRATPLPHIPGLQTATVTGPAGEEIHTDKYGRIKVQFHWDREGQRDDRSSCWVRVGQAWGGLSWGALYLPRMGQEVLVRFLEGNPDRPLIAGAVYNGENPTPYGLPAEKTKSTLKSASSLGSAGFNELRLEDKAGEEEIFVHAQKDEDLLTENDKNQLVIGYEDLLVKVDRGLTVEGNQRLDVTRDDSNLIEGNQTLQVKGDRSTTTQGSHSESVEGNQTISVSKNATYVISQNVSETVGAAKALSIGANYGITVALSLTEGVGGLKSVEIGSTYTERILGSRQEAVTGNKNVHVKKEFETRIEGAINDSTGKDRRDNVGGESHQEVTGLVASLARSFMLQADALSLIVGEALALRVEKSGNVTLRAKTFTLEGSDIKTKGSKIQKLGAGQKKSQSIAALDLQPLSDEPLEEGVLEMEVIDSSGSPLADQKFRIELPNGVVKTGKLDGQGRAKLDGIPPGHHPIVFPDYSGRLGRT